MAQLTWDQSGQKFYETGVSNGVLYVYDGEGTSPSGSSSKYLNGVAWNGLISVTESPSGAEATALYADNIKYLNLTSAEEFGCTVEAYMYPTEFAKCDGTAILTSGEGTSSVAMMIGQQARSTFGLAYLTKVGNDEQGDAYGRKLHLIYGCKAATSERAYSTVNDSPEAITFSWEISTTPITSTISGTSYTTSIITINEKDIPAAKWTALTNKLWGTSGETGTSAYLPLPDEIYTLLTSQG